MGRAVSKQLLGGGLLGATSSGSEVTLSTAQSKAFSGDVVSSSVASEVL